MQAVWLDADRMMAWYERLMAVRYKFVEVSTVTDAALEACVNEWVGQGWSLDGIHFVMRESSRRPAMAFVAFVREATSDSNGNAGEVPPHDQRPGSCGSD